MEKHRLYPLVPASIEADKLTEKIKKGEAENYTEAEEILKQDECVQEQQNRMEVERAVDDFTNTCVNNIKQFDPNRALSDQGLNSLDNRVKNEILKKARETINICMEREGYYDAVKLLKALEDNEGIKKLISRGIRNKKGFVNYDLFWATAKNGTTEQVREAIREWTAEEGLDEIWHVPYVAEREKKISQVYKKYLKKYKLRDRYGINLKILNGVYELKERDYDLVVGVLGGGSTTANFFEILGKNTRYLEWHRNWQTAPRWKSVGKNFERINKAKKILVCENDTKTGGTLLYLTDFFKKLNPAQVDVCFAVDYWGKNEENMKKMPFYGSCFQLENMPTGRFLEHLDNAVKRFEELETEL